MSFPSDLDILESSRWNVEDYDATQGLFYLEGWTDGLPVVPPTVERVEQFLAAAFIDPHEIIGDLSSRYRVVTAQKVAANAVMAGCSPEYFPAVIAIAKCILSPQYSVGTATTSTSGGAPLIIVNGPVIQELALRSGTNLFGTGNKANATIGRALSLIIQNCVGSTGALDRACIGHPGKYTWCVAEDEDDYWEPLHVEQGFDRGQSAVTVLHLEGPQHVRDETSNRPESLLDNFADHVRNWNQGGHGLLVFNAEHRAILQKAGWDKKRIASYVYEKAIRTVADLKRASRVIGDVTMEDEQEVVRVLRNADDLIVLGAGGPGVFSAVVPPYAGGAVSHSPVTEALVSVATYRPPTAVSVKRTGNADLAICDPTVAPNRRSAERAQRPVSLDGKRLTFLSNGKPGAIDLLEQIAKILKDTQNVVVTFATKPGSVPAGRILTEYPDLAESVFSDSEAVVTAVGDCGSCSLASVHDAVLLERRGIPAVVIITEPFIGTGRAAAAMAGMDGYPLIAVEHPVARKTSAELRSVAEEVVPQIAALLTGTP